MAITSTKILTIVTAVQISVTVKAITSIGSIETSIETIESETEITTILETEILEETAALTTIRKALH